MSGSHHSRATRLRWWLPLLFAVAGAAFAYSVLTTQQMDSKGGETVMTRALTGGGSSDAATVCARATIGPGGGTLRVKGSGTPAEGLKASVPAGALEQEDEVSLGYSGRNVRIRAGTGSGKVLFLGTRHASSFEQPVVLEVPLEQKLFSGLAIPYEVDDEGRLHVMDIKSIDEEHLRLRLYTFKPCTFTWVYP